MALTAERRQEILEGLKGNARFHGAFRYPEECYAFADLADKETVERPAVDGYAYKVYVFTDKDKQPNAPVHVNIHGGGWVNPHQINDELFSAWLARQIHGVVVDVDYTLTSVASWPVPFDQCCDVMHYVYENCEAWDCDPKRISVGGYSAGGQLATAIGLKMGQTGEVPICLVVNGYAPLDMKTDPLDKVGGHQRTMPVERERLFTELLIDGDENLKSNPYVSPVYASDEMLATMPRTLICSAGECNFRFENEAFGHRLASLGVEVTMRRFLGACHGFIPHFMERWEEGADLIVRSINDAHL